MGAGAAPGLGLAASALWGSGDFAGGLAARRGPAMRVVLAAHGSSLLLLLPFALAHSPLKASGMAAAFLSGVSGAVGLAAFYRALALGAMGTPAAVAGLLTAAIPVLLGMPGQGLPAPMRLAGFLLAGFSIWLVAGRAPERLSPAPATKPGTRREAGGKQALLLAGAAGLGFGIQLVLLHVAGKQGVLWAMTASRMGGVTAAALFVLAGRFPADASPVDNPGTVAWRAFLLLACVAGVLDAAGNLLYTVASVLGRMDVAAVLASLYPVVTILLAAWLLKERATRRQWAGIGLAMAAVVLISV